MSAIRHNEGQIGGPAFTKLHHLSTTQYLLQTALVVSALAFIPAAPASRNDRCATDATP